MDAYQWEMRRKRIILIALIQRRIVKKYKREWIRKIFQRREIFGEYHTLIHELRVDDEPLFFTYFRMKPSTFDMLVNKISPLIEKKNTRFRKSISPAERLAITLRYLATGDALTTISFSFRTGLSTTAGIVHETCCAIWTALVEEYMPAPNKEKWLQIASEFNFFWNFPNCIGAIDGKHVNIQAPQNSGSKYFNYKSNHSIILMAICDAKYYFTLVNVGDYGRISDGGVFASSFGDYFHNERADLPTPTYLPGSTQLCPYVLVGDEAFPLKEYMMRPFSGKFLPVKKRIFNYRLSRSRRTIENTFGILASRWRIFRRPIILKPENVDNIIKAAWVLHNFVKIEDDKLPSNEKRYCPRNYVDREDNEGTIIAGEWRLNESMGLSDLLKTGSNMYSRNSSELRDTYADYFISTIGSIPWQNNI